MKSLLLVGSSIFAQWGGASKRFPEYTVFNAAIGGTVTVDWIAYLPQVLASINPDVILYYCGSNDLNADVSRDDIIKNILECRHLISAAAPQCKFAYFSIMKAPQKADKWQLIDDLNERVESLLPAGDLYVESNKALFQDGKLISDLFQPDQLHLTWEAYEQFRSVIEPKINGWLNKVS